jgi:hypothetical protein
MVIVTGRSEIKFKWFSEVLMKLGIS